MGIKAIDFFCGVGGATKGLQNAGIEVLKGIDIDESCQKTYNENCSPARFLLADINTLDPKKVLADTEIAPSDFLLFVACAPCQPFSRSNKRKSETDKRKNLILRFLDFVTELEPDAVFIENVPGFEQAEGGSFLSILEKKLGYTVNFSRINAKVYGVPQNRSRLIGLASKYSKIEFPIPSHGKGLLKLVTVKEIIAKYPSIPAGNLESATTTPNHLARSVSDLNMLRLKNTPQNGGSRKDWPSHLWLKCHKGDSAGHSDVYGRMSWDKPSPTLTCKCNSISNGRFGHPEQDRAISLREAAALQTFPDSFVFYGGQCDIAKHIGNAVPPLLAKTIGTAIKQNLLNPKLA